MTMFDIDKQTSITLKRHRRRGNVFEVVRHGIEYTVKERALVTSVDQTWAGNLENRIKWDLFDLEKGL